MKDCGNGGAQPSGENCQSGHVDNSRRIPRKKAQAGIGCNLLDECAARWCSRKDSTVTYAERIPQRCAEHMVLFERYELASRPVQEQFVVELVVLRRRRVVKHVAARQVVFLREMVVDPRGKVILAGNLRTAEAEKCHIPGPRDATGALERTVWQGEEI